ncbi:MAG TPA: YlxR family protein, partial [Jiangellaceae bacterium]|nr:YlxR family protein [Jiangellaceae bacterium]
GRGAYLHYDPGCLDLAERRRAFPRALRLAGPLDTGVLRRWLEQRVTGQEEGDTT